jgi:hypothetical protein
VPFGFGIVSYFNLIKFLMFVFIGLSLFSIPTLVIYWNGGNFVDQLVQQVGLGNLG